MCFLSLFWNYFCSFFSMVPGVIRCSCITQEEIITINIFNAILNTKCHHQARYLYTECGIRNETQIEKKKDTSIDREIRIT